MLRRVVPALMFGLLAVGCGRSAAPVLSAGDVVRPEIAFAPDAPWPVGTMVSIGVLFRVESREGEGRYLRDDEVTPEQAVMSARVTFLDGDRPVGEPLDVPLVKDC